MSKLSLAFIILTIAVLQGRSIGDLPCKNTSPWHRYGTFKQRHVLAKEFDRDDKQNWGR